MHEPLLKKKPAISKRLNLWILITILLYVSILLFPRLSVKLRYDDILLVLLAPFLLIYSIKRPIFSSIEKHYLLFVFYSFIGAFGFYITSGFITVFALPLKEFTYILIYVIVKNTIRVNPTSFKYFFKISTLFISLISIVYAFLQLINGVPMYYGVGHISEPQNSSFSAIIFYALAIINFVLYKDSGKFLYVAISVLLMALVFLTGSRTGVVLLLIFLGLYLCIKYKLFYSIYLYLLLCICSIIYFYFGEFLFQELFNNNFENGIIHGSIRRFGTLFNFIEALERSRFPWWREMFAKFLENPYFGCGRGCSHSILDNQLSLGLAGDMGYFKSLVELGIIGSLLYYSIFVRLVMKVKNFSLEGKSIYLAFIFSFLFAEFSFEIFQTSKGGALFWFIVAYISSYELLYNR
jgi:hypothetical protein